MAEKTSYTIEQLAEDERKMRADDVFEGINILLNLPPWRSQQIDPEVEPDVEVDGEASDPASPPESPQALEPPVAPIITPIIEPAVEVPTKEGV